MPPILPHGRNRPPSRGCGGSRCRGHTRSSCRAAPPSEPTMSLAVPHAPARPGRARRTAVPRGSCDAQLAAVRDLLVAESPAAYDGWLAAREARGMRERTLLLRRVAALARDRPHRARAGRPGRGGPAARRRRAAPAPRPRDARGTRSSSSSAGRSRTLPADWGRPCDDSAEGAGFEPAAESLPATAFKAVPIGHSGTPPSRGAGPDGTEQCTDRARGGSAGERQQHVALLDDVARGRPRSR